jgi:hypothetical protein
MKFFIDDHGFVTSALSEGSHCYQPACENFTCPQCILLPGFVFTDTVTDAPYGIPKYKIIEGQFTEVADPVEYQVHPPYWSAYLLKLTDEVDVLIGSSTDQELKDIYDASPAYKQDIIYSELERLAGLNIPQNSMNLSLEIMVRVFAEWMHIQYVEQRPPTTDETNGILNVLSMLHNHSYGMGMPISTTSWYQYYLNAMLTASDNLRMVTLAKRYFVCGRS